jgi:hypothetical protein
LRRNPALAADLLALHNRCLRLRQEPRTLAALVLAVLLGALLLLLAVVQAAAWLASAFAWLLTHAVWVGVLTVLYAFMQVGQRRLQVEQRHALSWLVAAAPTLGMPRMVLLSLTLWPMLLQMCLAIGALLAMGCWYGRIAPAGLLSGWIVAGGALGATAAWWRHSRQRLVRLRYEDSRYVPRLRNRNPRHHPSLNALARLPVTRAQAWFRPENARLFVFVVIATMPAGTSALSGLCALSVALLAYYAGALARAVMQTGSEAARWLQATPIQFVAFAWPIMGRSVVHQIIVSLGVAALLLPLGATVGALAYLVLLWLALVLMSWCLWLQGCFHGQRPWLKVVGSVATALGVEQFARGAGIASALLWTCWNLRSRPS